VYSTWINATLDALIDKERPVARASVIAIRIQMQRL
jgi:hypothetical protein